MNMRDNQAWDDKTKWLFMLHNIDYMKCAWIANTLEPFRLFQDPIGAFLLGKVDRKIKLW